MGNVFSVAEVLDLGIEKEKKRRDFYDAVANKFKEKEMKELFVNLRDWEAEHIEKFQEIKKGVDDTEATESYSGERQDYMQVLVNEKLYKESTLTEFMQTVTTPLVAIQHGMGFEREAILFFSELQNFLRDVFRSIVGKLIDEEKQHLIYLGALRKKIRA